MNIFVKKEEDCINRINERGTKNLWICEGKALSSLTVLDAGVDSAKGEGGGERTKNRNFKSSVRTHR